MKTADSAGVQNAIAAGGDVGRGGRGVPRDGVRHRGAAVSGVAVRRAAGENGGARAGDRGEAAGARRSGWTGRPAEEGCGSERTARGGRSGGSGEAGGRCAVQGEGGADKARVGVPGAGRAHVAEGEKGGAAREEEESREVGAAGGGAGADAKKRMWRVWAASRCAVAKRSWETTKGWG